MMSKLAAFWAGGRAWLRAEGGRRTWALGLAALVLAALLATLPQAGLTDDDDFYVPAAISYARWVGRAVTLAPGSWTRAEIDRAFAPNHEHPPMAKYVMGATWWLFSDVLGVASPMNGARAGVSFLAALLAFVVAAMGFLLRGPAGAVTAVACLFLLPRFFFHSQVGTLDVPVASLTTVTLYLAWRARRSFPHAVAAALAFGAALLTKLNAPFLLVALGLHWLLRAGRVFRTRQGRLVIPPVPVALVLMVVVGPLMFLLLWPHLWFDTASRLGAYVAFHLNHYPIYLYYFGTLYTQTIAPWHMPWVMAAAVTPVAILALMVAGAGRAVVALGQEVRAPGEPAVLPVNDDEERDSLRALLLVQAFISIGIVSFTGVPKYGGEKLFMPFFPVMAVLAADGAALVAAGLRSWWTAAPRWVEHAPAGVAVASGLWALVAVSPFNLSYYSAVLGGPRGAEALGFENTYYDVADKKLVAWFNAHAPPGARVHFEPNHKEYVRTWNWLGREGVLRRDIVTAEENQADYVVLTHERRWSSYPALEARLRKLPVAHEQTLDGVRLYTVYQRR